MSSWSSRAAQGVCRKVLGPWAGLVDGGIQQVHVVHTILTQKFVVLEPKI